MNPRDLIATARGLTEISRRRPSQANLRRSPAWHRVYRALEHGKAKRACLQSAGMRGFPLEVRSFAAHVLFRQR